MPFELSSVRLEAPAHILPELASFYGDRLGLPTSTAEAGDLIVEVGESTLEFHAVEGMPYYHFALLVPGDRFDAALAWARDRVELLPDRETGEVVFAFTNWGALALYFHDPAGSIVELIAHRGIGERGVTGLFDATELIGISEIGIVCDPLETAARVERELGLQLWDGTVEGVGRLAFVGEKARTLILCRAGRPWLPTERPSEAHAVEVVVSGPKAGSVPLGATGSVSVKAS